MFRTILIAALFATTAPVLALAGGSSDTASGQTSTAKVPYAYISPTGVGPYNDSR